MLSGVWLFATPWTVACQVSLSMEFPRQEYLSGLPCPPPGDLPDAGIKPKSPVSPALVGVFFISEPLGKPTYSRVYMLVPNLYFIPPLLILAY